jgi:hypothetical protein
MGTRANFIGLRVCLENRLPLSTKLPRGGLFGNSKGQGRKKKKAFGVTDSASLSSKVFVVG